LFDCLGSQQEYEGTRVKSGGGGKCLVNFLIIFNICPVACEAPGYTQTINELGPQELVEREKVNKKKKTNEKYR
jgi:hypothetical protein